MYLAHALHQCVRPVYPADLPAGHAEGLARAAHRHRALEHPRQRGDWHVLSVVEDQVLVDFIADDREIVRVTQRRHRLQLRPAQDAPGGVLRCVEDDSARAWRDRLAQQRGVQAPIRGQQRHVDRHRPGHLDVGHVGVEVRLDDDHLVAGVNQAHDRHEERAGGPRRNQRAVCRVYVQVVALPGVRGDGGFQVRGAAAGRVLVVGSRPQRAGVGLDKGVGAVEVRLALAQVDCVVLLGQVVDFCEDVGAVGGQSLRCTRHDLSPVRLSRPWRTGPHAGPLHRCRSRSRQLRAGLPAGSSAALPRCHP